MRQRSVQMRLEGLTSFACPIDADRGAQEQSLRGFSSSAYFTIRSWNHSAFVALLRLYNCLHIVRLHGALGRWWYLANWQFFLEA